MHAHQFDHPEDGTPPAATLHATQHSYLTSDLHYPCFRAGFVLWGLGD